jgi:hypothetical protein
MKGTASKCTLCGQRMVTMSASEKFRSYDEFFQFYLHEHSDAGNRRMHALGMFLGFVVAVAAVATRHYRYVLLWVPIAYALSFAGHFLIEKNKPATFGHPFWSFISDFRMLGLMVTGRLNAHLQTRRTAPSRQ